MPAIVFRHVPGTDSGVYKYTIAQPTAETDIVVLGDPELDVLSSSVTAELRRHGLSERMIQIQTARSLHRHQNSGKLRQFIS
ncbi:hypothetical protein [Mycobacterium uberis]|uniref:hypothetical protein n=1 Tax=Mycobacterium uberis TaxID=2162698 RepID=UPI001FB4C544|nr:hypothetical protein [Mycobacterium uberis]